MAVLSFKTSYLPLFLICRNVILLGIMIEKEKIILFIVCLVVYVFHEFIEILLYFVRLFLERITSALREYL